MNTKFHFYPGNYSKLSGNTRYDVLLGYPQGNRMLHAESLHEADLFVKGFNCAMYIIGMSVYPTIYHLEPLSAHENHATCANCKDGL